MTGSEISSLIYAECRAKGLPLALSNLIVSQARHETADYTSNVFKSCNNLFGYKYVGQALSTGPCVASPEGDRYAAYSSYANSVAELVAWIVRRQKEGIFPQNLAEITTAEKYAELLKAGGYYGSTVTVYASGLKRFLQTYGGGIGIVGLLIGISVFLYFHSR